LLREFVERVAQSFRGILANPKHRHTWDSRKHPISFTLALLIIIWGASGQLFGYSRYLAACDQ
jgi:hypothetical protein